MTPSSHSSDSTTNTAPVLKKSKAKADLSVLTAHWRKKAPVKAYYDRVCRNIAEDIKREKGKLPAATLRVKHARKDVVRANNRLSEMQLKKEMVKSKISRLMQELTFRVQVILKAEKEKDDLRFKLKKLGLAQDDLFHKD